MTLELSRADEGNLTAGWPTVTVISEGLSAEAMLGRSSATNALPGVERVLDRLEQIARDGDDHEYLPEDDTLDGCNPRSRSAIAVRGVGCSGIGPEADFVHTTLMIVAGQELQDDRPLWQGRRSSASKNERSCELAVVAFVNNKRIDQNGCLASSCACRNAIRRAKAWESAGVTISEPTTERMPLKLSASSGCRLRGAWLVVHLRMRNVLFSDQSQTCIDPAHNLAAPVQSALADALAQVCIALHVLWAFGGENRHRGLTCFSASLIATHMTSGIGY